MGRSVREPCRGIETAVDRGAVVLSGHLRAALHGTGWIRPCGGGVPGGSPRARGRRLHARPHRHQLLGVGEDEREDRSEEHTSELQSLMRNSYAVFCLKKKKQKR